MTTEEQAAADKAAADKAAAEKAAADKLAADKTEAERKEKEAADKAGSGGGNGPVDTLVKDVARLKEKVGLDAPTSKKSADADQSLWCASLFK